jgi:hypothetical protein
MVLLCGTTQAQRLQIQSFSVGPDQTLSYPNDTSKPGQLTDLADEHTTIFPPASAGAPYLFFASSKLSGGIGGAVVLPDHGPEDVQLRDLSGI